MLRDGWPREGVVDEWFEGAMETAYARRYPSLMAIFQDGLARFGDGEGFYTIVARKKDMILRGGENVYSVEVENLISMNPKVLQVAVIGVTDQVLGEKIKAVVFPMPGHGITAEEVPEFCRGRIADHKVPEFVVISEGPLPLNPGGKIMKDLLRGLE